MKLTVFNFKGNIENVVNVGDIVSLSKGDKSPHHIVVKLDGQDIGVCSEALQYLIPGTTSSMDASSLFTQDNQIIEAKVIKKGDYITLANGVNKSAVIVEIIQLANSATSEDNSYVLKMGGNMKKAPNKGKLLIDFASNSSLYVSLTVNDDNQIVAHYDDKIAGLCAEREGAGLSTIAEIQKVKELIGADSIDAKVISTDSSSFNIEVIVSKKVVEELEDKQIEAISKVNNVTDSNIVAEITDYLRSNGFSAKQIQKVIESHKAYPDEIKSRIPKSPTIKYIDSDEINALRLGYGAMIGGLHLLCKGAKGTGKNEFAKTLAWVFQRPLYEFSTNADSSKEDLQGGKTVDSVEENGVVKTHIAFDAEILLQAMEVGGIFVVDEMNFADPGVLGVLNSAIDSRRTMEVPGYKKVVASPDFCMIATMNPEYIGTRELNEALNDRFVPVVFVPHESIYEILKVNCPNCSDKYISYADSIYKSIRKLIVNNDRSISSDCLTIRGFIQALYYISEEILPAKQAFKCCVANKVDDSLYKETLETIINSKVK